MPLRNVHRVLDDQLGYRSGAAIRSTSRKTGRRAASVGETRDRHDGQDGRR